MVEMASSMGDLKGFRINDLAYFDILQFANDTILIRDGSWDNLWCFKAILRDFELASNLRVNLNKSLLLGFNLDSDFLQAGSSFLNCEIGSSSFVFLGIPVGINPRRREVWKPIVSKLRRRLGGWQNIHLSNDGRVVLLNSILSSILIFMFSFYKAPKAIIKEIILLQRSFLWGGDEVKKNICWIGLG
ncbi:uncharacterized protein LOC131623553 [Vicia villosa]|uniref:uncharacterized protein LOC131623553 n=1 Tax=Vicia villosa TaxID=3911 RepID=UPI00273AC330|nr:uncharacterized protein LOC131623553 [Vicia villosa]